MSRSRVPLFLVCCLLVSCAAMERESTPDPEPPPRKHTEAATSEDVEFVRNHLAERRLIWCGNCAAEHAKKLNRLDEKRLVAVCDVLVAKPENSAELADAFGLLCGVRGDRRRFVDPAAKALEHSDARVRYCAAQLLGHIGSRNEIPALLALLSDPDALAAYGAAEALAAIGGPSEVAAMDAWMVGKPREDVIDVKNARAKLASRLVEEGELPPGEKP